MFHFIKPRSADAFSSVKFPFNKSRNATRLVFKVINPLWIAFTSPLPAVNLFCWLFWWWEWDTFISLKDGLTWSVGQFVPGNSKGSDFSGQNWFLCGECAFNNPVLCLSSMHSIPKENKVIVWIRRFLFTQSKPLSLSQKFWPWAWRPSPFVAIREDQMKTRSETSSSCAVEPREARANYHFEYRSPRINSVERLCCGILDGHQGRTQRCAGRLSPRCHSHGVVGSQHRF